MRGTADGPKEKVAQGGFDPPSSRLWALHANHCATELCASLRGCWKGRRGARHKYASGALAPGAFGSSTLLPILTIAARGLGVSPGFSW